MDAQRGSELKGWVGRGKSNSKKALRNFENKGGNPEACGMLLRGQEKREKSYCSALM